MYDLFYFIRGQARKLQSITGKKLAECQEILAKSYHCQSFHELRKVARSPNCQDERLAGVMVQPGIPLPPWADYLWPQSLERQAIQLSDIFGINLVQAANLVARLHGYPSSSEVKAWTWDNIMADLHMQLDLELSNILSGPIAETNATDFWLENNIFNIVEVERLDPVTIICRGDAEYNGEQDEDRPWCGTNLSFIVEVRATYSDEGKWKLEDLQVRNVSSDFNTIDLEEA